MKTALDPSVSGAVADALLPFLSERLGARALQFAERPQPLGRGFASFLYTFRLTLPDEPGGPPLSTQRQLWSQPLVIRILGSEGEGPVLDREAAIQRFALSLGYSAIDPLIVESASAAIGLPFAIMPRIAGVTLFDKIKGNPLATRRWLRAMAGAHVALHRLPIEGCPLPYDAPLVQRRLAGWRSSVEQLGTGELQHGLSWLTAHQHLVAIEQPSLCHNDFHPLNIMVGPDDRLTVLDWGDAALGDRHCDVGRTVALLGFVHIAASNAAERLLLRAVRGYLRNGYLSAYRERFPVDPLRLCYWEAVHTFHGWLQLVELRYRGAVAPEARLATVQRLPSALIDEVRRHFATCTERVARLERRA